MNNQELPSDNPSGTARRDIAILVVLTAILLLPSFFTRDLWNPDEPRYMEVAREMPLLKQYVIPHLNGETYAEKPPLFYWLAAGVYGITGSFTSGRTVDFLAMLGTLILMYHFGRRLLPGPGGIIAAVVLATTMIYWVICGYGVLDPLLTFFTTSGIVAAYVGYHSSHPRAKWLWLVFYAASGLAIPVKGPVGLVVPGLFLLVYGILARRGIRAGGWVHLAGAFLMLTVVAAWLVPAILEAYRTGQGWYVDTILWKQSAGRAVDSYSHRNPFYYYVVQLPYYLLPWTFFFALGLVQALQDWRRKGDRNAAVFAFWFITVLVFFSFISGKRERYILPAMRAVALVTARYFALGLRDGFRWPRLHKAFAVATIALLGFITLGLAVGAGFSQTLARRIFASDPDQLASLRHLLRPSVVWPFLSVMTLLTVGAVWRLRSFARDAAARQVVLTLALFMALEVLSVQVFVYPVLNEFKSSRSFGERARGHLESEDKKYFYRSEFSGVVNLYSGVVGIPVIELAADAPARLADALKEPVKVVVISDEKWLETDLPSPPADTWVIVEEQVGHRGMMLISNKRLSDDAKLLSETLEPVPKKVRAPRAK
jgi:4-amino-4-deoxy-L-arabinose transferase-like glycosyltransferase